MTTSNYISLQERDKAYRYMTTLFKGRDKECLDIESCAFVSSNTKKSYGNTLWRVTCSLIENPLIWNKYSSKDIVFVEPDVLCLDLPLHKWRVQYYTKLKESYKEEHMSSKTATQQTDKDNEGVVICSRCKSTNVVWQQRQTKGADESMTLFFTCNNCNKRWKMS